jgi:hypothetical protein
MTGGSPERRRCFSEPCRRLFDFFRSRVRALDVVNHLMPQHSELCGAINVTGSLGLVVKGRDHHGAKFPIERSIDAGVMNLLVALSGLDHAPLGRPDPATQREIEGDATLLIQQLIGAFEGAFGSINALSCPSQFQGQNVVRHPANVGFQSIHHGLLTHDCAVRSLIWGCGGSPHGSRRRAPRAGISGEFAHIYPVDDRAVYVLGLTLLNEPRPRAHGLSHRLPIRGQLQLSDLLVTGRKASRRWAERTISTSGFRWRWMIPRGSRTASLTVETRPSCRTRTDRTAIALSGPLRHGGGLFLDRGAVT